jgi:hypothetical protein
MNPQTLLGDLYGKFDMFPITVASEPDGESPVDSNGVPQRVPIKLRIGKRSQDGFLRTWAGQAQVAVVQTDQDHSNLTQIAVVLSRSGPPNVPDELKTAFKWRTCSLHRRKRGDLQLRISQKMARSLAHPLPLGVWTGVVCLEHVLNPKNCLVALEHQTLTVRKVEPTKQSQIVGPDGLSFEARPLPELVLP